MPDCATIDPLVTPYIDGEIAAADRAVLERHMRACPPCRARIARERAVRELVGARTQALHAGCASLSLHARCAAAGREAGRALAPPPAAATWRARLAAFAVAATLVVIVGGAFLYPLTARSNRVMASELALDHMKCSLFNAALGTQHDAAHVEQSLASDFSWPARLPEQPEQAGLELVGERTCLYGEGRVAHVMYRHQGRPVSVFMLPDDVRKEEIVEVLGHRAAIWSVGGRTFVLVGREPHDELNRMASFVKAGLR
jgi:anti-sigma factor RsiW